MRATTPTLARIVDKVGPSLFWGIWCGVGGWALAIYCNAIPAESAGVKLAASFLAPAAGAAFAIMGALKVMRETGRREGRRALNQLHAAVSTVHETFKGLMTPGDDFATLHDFIRGRGPLISMLEVDDGALHAADTVASARLYRTIRLSMKSLEILLNNLGSAPDIDALRGSQRRKLVASFENVLPHIESYRQDVEELLASGSY